MHQRADDWVVAAAWAALAIAFAGALYLAYDIFVRGHRQKMTVMNAVYPITALYWGPVAVWFYLRRGRRRGDEEDLGREVLGAPWWSTSKGVAHCGAGCTLGDIAGEWIVFTVGWSIALFASSAANDLMAMFVADFALAWLFGIAFQYFAIVPMNEDMGKVEGMWQAIKADTLSIVAFQVGLFGYMALYHLVIWQPPLAVDTPEYWFMMQVGMIIGFFTAWPVNAWLIRRGIKERM